MNNIHFFIACEDQLAKALCLKLISYALPNATYNDSIITGGCGELRKKIKPFLKIAEQDGYATLILTDLDQIENAEQLKIEWLEKNKAPRRFFLHVSVREAESWVLADIDGFSNWASILKCKIPKNSDQELNPKEKLLSIFKKYSKSEFKQDILPRSSSQKMKVGIGYNARLVDFVVNHWCIEKASLNSKSLSDSIQDLKKLIF